MDMRSRSTATAATFVLAALLVAGPAIAQDTGGSFGGSDFGGGGGGGDFGGGGGGGGSSDWGSGGSSSDWGSSGSSDWGSSGSSSGGGWGSSGSSHSRTGGSLHPGSFFCALMFVVIVIVVIQVAKSYRAPTFRHLSPRPRAHVSALQIAIDWRERAAVQAVLAELAASGDLKSRAGLDKLLDATLGEIGRRQEAVRLAYWFTEPSFDMKQCEARFRQIASAERSRFQRELVRAEGDGVVKEDAGALVASSEEGQGFVVVTIVVAARKAPPPASTTIDRAGLAAVANALASNTPETMLALEVVWIPAAEQDRMSSAEMQAIFPHLRAVDPAATAAGLPEIGRVSCTFCGAVYAAELGACPQCGARRS